MITSLLCSSGLRETAHGGEHVFGLVGQGVQRIVLRVPWLGADTKRGDD